jgi:HlyD family secretion protein
MRKFSVVILILVILAIALQGAFQGLVDAGDEGLSRELSYTKVERKTIRSDLTFMGNITPANHVEIRSEVSGRAAEVFKKVGDLVTQNELVVRLDERLLQNEKRQLEIDISTANLQVEIAQRNYEELEALGSDYAGRNEVLNKKAELGISRNEISRLKIRLREVEEKLRKVRILSPIAGTVLSVGIQPWQVVAGAEAYSGGTLLMEVADLEHLIVEGKVNQAEIGKLRPGARGRAESLLDSKAFVPCLLKMIEPVARKDEDTSRYFKVEIELLDTHRQLRPGMTTRLVFPLKESPNALSVPVQAVFTESEKSFVYRYHPVTKKIDKIPVTLGVLGLDDVEIKEGLGENDIVLLEHPFKEAEPVPQGKLKISTHGKHSK